MLKEIMFNKDDISINIREQSKQVANAFFKDKLK